LDHIAVQQENKVAAAVQSFLCIYKLRKFAADAENGLLAKNKEKRHCWQSFTYTEIQEVSKTFDTFDRDGSGVITATELKELMQSLGAPVSESTIKNMVRRLDHDGDGQI
jgi:hypothetical protein